MGYMDEIWAQRDFMAGVEAAMNIPKERESEAHCRVDEEVSQPKKEETTVNNKPIQPTITVTQTEILFPNFKAQTNDSSSLTRIILTKPSRPSTHSSTLDLTNAQIQELRDICNYLLEKL